MKPFFGRVELHDTERVGLGAVRARYLDAGPARAAVAERVRPCDPCRPYGGALPHEPAG